MVISAARLVLGVAKMYRVALTAGLAAALAGCSLGSTSISSGFTEPETTSSVAPSSYLSSSKSVGLGGEPAAPRGTQVAMLDKAPSGTYEHAEPGVLANRDYSR